MGSIGAMSALETEGVGATRSLGTEGIRLACERMRGKSVLHDQYCFITARIRIDKGYTGVRGNSLKK